MSPTLHSLLPFIPLALVIPIAIALWRSNKKRVAAWAEFAERHGLKAEGLRIEGTYEDYPLTLKTVMRGGGQHRHVVTELRLEVRDVLPPRFSLHREGLGDKVLKAFGKKDEELGDEQFDRHFKLKELTPEVATLLHRAEVQQHLYEMLNQYQSFHLHDGWIHAERRGAPSTPDGLDELLGPALMLAHTLEQTSRRLKAWKTG